MRIKLGENKLNSIKGLISTALNDGQISEQEFKMVLDELDKYNDLKDKTHTKQSGLNEQEKKKLIEQGKAQALIAIQKKDKRYIMLFNEPPPVYQETQNYRHGWNVTAETKRCVLIHNAI